MCYLLFLFLFIKRVTLIAHITNGFIDFQTILGDTYAHIKYLK